MRVIHECAMLVQGVLILERFAGLDGALAQTAYTIHPARPQEAVPMDACWRRQTIGDVDAHVVALDCLNGWSMDATIVAPALGDKAGREFVRHRLGDEMKDLHTIDDLPWQREAVGCDDRLIADAG